MDAACLGDALEAEGQQRPRWLGVTEVSRYSPYTTWVSDDVHRLGSSQGGTLAAGISHHRPLTGHSSLTLAHHLPILPPRPITAPIVSCMHKALHPQPHKPQRALESGGAGYRCSAVSRSCKHGQKQAPARGPWLVRNPPCGICELRREGPVPDLGRTRTAICNAYLLCAAACMHASMTRSGSEAVRLC
jgi:hypothetical protein